MLLAVMTACGDTAPTMTRAELLDPESCKTCHPSHYDQWAGSMHAYAADDPVFIAMNARGQRETNGALGDFCVSCHAPMAVREGATSDGLNLAELPQHLKGVTCYFCHSVDAVEGTHNNPLRLADDLLLRGGLADPFGQDAHGVKYSPLHDRRDPASSTMCGACHDIVTHAGVHIERTFTEYKESVFNLPDPKSQLTCSQCHMQGDIPGVVADVDGVPLRYPRDHSFPGVDIALGPWPDRARQKALVQEELDSVLVPKLCVTPDGPGVKITYTLDNAFAGHSFPSGAAHDRRAWAEVRAFQGEAEIYSSGKVANGESVTTLEDPDLWQMRDFATDENGEKAHMFWDIRAVEIKTLPAGVTNDPTDPRFFHAVSRDYRIVSQIPDRVTVRVRLVPVGFDVLDDLIESGDLDPAVRDEMPTFDLASTIMTWTMADGYGCVMP